jgi:DNA-directed RNA polymerase subunit RPC12/RpoP
MNVNEQVSDCRFPYRCAACGTHAGMPVLASNYKDHLRIVVQCTNCNEAWTLRFDQPALFSQPQSVAKRHTRSSRQRPASE